MTDAAPFGRGRVRRLLGLDRTGRKPRPTRSGEPLRPLTIPNLVGYARLAALPVFLYLAFESGDGRSAASATVFVLIAAGDYLDGFLARVTGQYSRMGALLDPLVDRLTILSGVVVCWHFELLPRWALAVLVVRECAMLVLGRYGQTHGVELRINWPGRIGVGPLMASFFFAMAGLHTLGEVLLYVGLALALAATVLYARSGLAQLRESPRRRSEQP